MSPTPSQVDEPEVLRRRIQERLRFARNEMGLTLKAVAEEADVSVTSLQSLETDERSELSLLKVARVAYVLGISLDSLLSEAPPAAGLSGGVSLDQALTALSAHDEDNFLKESRFIDLDGWLPLIQELDFKPAEVGTVWEQDGTLELNRKGMFDLSTTSYGRQNGYTKLLFASLLWSESASKPGRRSLRSGLRGASPFQVQDLSRLEQDLDDARALLLKNGVAAAVEQMLTIQGIGILRACAFVYGLSADSYREGRWIEAETPLAIPFNSRAEKALIEAGYLQDSPHHKRVEAYMSYVIVVNRIARVHGIRPDMVELAAFPAGRRRDTARRNSPHFTSPNALVPSDLAMNEAKRVVEPPADPRAIGTIE